MGGDEFSAALFYEKDTDLEEIKASVLSVFDRISHELTSSYQGTSISMGAAMQVQDKAIFNDLYISADAKLYESKKAGRGKLSLDVG